MQTWYDNIVTAVDHCARPQTNIFGDIRRFFRRDNDSVGVSQTVIQMRRAATSAVVSTKNKIQSKIFNFSFSRPSLG